MLSLDKMAQNSVSSILQVASSSSQLPLADSDLNKKLRKTCEKASENLYVTANEPLIGAYRIQEHCHKTVPQLINKMIDMEKTESKLRGLLYDVEYSNSTVRTVQKSIPTFESIDCLLSRALNLKQQIDYDTAIKQHFAEKQLQEQQQRSRQNDEVDASSRKIATNSQSIVAVEDEQQQQQQREQHQDQQQQQPQHSSLTNKLAEISEERTAVQESSTTNRRHTSASSSSTLSSTKSALNRFSTSFDFRNIPANVANDLRDFRSFISNFTTSTTSTPEPPHQSPQPLVTNEQNRVALSPESTSCETI